VLRYYEDCGPNFEVALVVALESTTTGQRFEQSRTCPAPLVEEPPVPGTPPTSQEVWDQLPLWAPSAALAPACRGVVGRPTRTWAVASPEVTTDVTLNGATWSVVAEPVGWRVAADGGPEPASPTAAVAASAASAYADPSRADRPDGELLFTRRGVVDVRATEIWTGSYSGPAGTFTLDYVDVTALAASYRVIEVQAVVVGPGTRAEDPSASLPCGS
jgi:hypothetical protein